MKIVHVLFVIGFLSYKISAAEIGSAKGIQIINPVNHSFELQLNDLKPILESVDLKDRHVVVVSIAGAFRQGKSFLMNFFIKYLNAQYNKHDVTDWIGEKANNADLSGFKWRSGRKRETLGIWMWSEIFTHDYDNGDKVAIILLDTQGIFDDQSSVRDCTTIFALSMLLSSVQCYNLIQNIREDDLQHLELFTEYGRLALEQSNEKPFQKLLFIVRDWPFGYETNYGWHGQKVIDEILAGNSEQTPEMTQLRKRLDSSFNDIGAFLMPHPGKAVAQGNTFTGDLKQIDPEFVQYVKELVPALFAPDKLIAKTINGQKMRAQDLLQYLQAYVNIFNGDTLPEPKTVFMATAEASNLILHKNSLNFYIDEMQKTIDAVEYLSENDLNSAHQKTKTEAVAMFTQKPKLGGDQFASTFQQKIEADIEVKFADFKQTNEEKRKLFVEKANMHNEQLVAQIKASIEQTIQNEIEKIPSPIEYSKVNGFIMAHHQNAMQEFDSKKMGDAEISKDFREKLDRDLNELQSIMIGVSEAYNKFLNSHAESMQKLLIDTKSFVDQGELLKLQQVKKSEIIAQCAEQLKAAGAQTAIIIQRKLEKHIDEKFVAIEQENQKKREEFNKLANTHNENLCREIKVMFENKMLNGIGSTYLNDDAFIGLFIRSKGDALTDFGSRKMGDGAESNSHREHLERDLDGLQSFLKGKNEANKPPPPPPPPQNGRGRKGDRILDAAIPIITGIVGGLLG